MKRILLSSLLVLSSLVLLEAQSTDGTLLQPKQVSGLRLNASGEVTAEHQACFAHAGNGKVVSFIFPDFAVTSSWSYDGDTLKRFYTHHAGGHPLFNDWIDYTYENGRIRYISHIWSQMESDQYWEYNYYDDGRLAIKYYGEYSPDDRWCYWRYEYPNWKTKVVSYFREAVVGTHIVYRLNYRETYEYDDDYALLSVWKDSYDADSVVYKSERTLYGYLPDGSLETEIHQELVDGEWANATIKAYVYEDDGRMAERQSGSWSSESGEWNIDRKVVYEYSPEALTYTVTFYKKQSGEWVYDFFFDQPLFPEPELKEHEKAMGYFGYEDMNGCAHVNRFVFTLEETGMPIYVDGTSEKSQDSRYKVYPNPGSDRIEVAAPAESAVVRFYDMQGRLILARPFDFSTTVQADDWAPGIYLWEIWDGFKKASTGKWVKK